MVSINHPLRRFITYHVHIFGFVAYCVCVAQPPLPHIPLKPPSQSPPCALTAPLHPRHCADLDVMKVFLNRSSHSASAQGRDTPCPKPAQLRHLSGSSIHWFYQPFRDKTANI
jgi:hypothetical protein